MKCLIYEILTFEPQNEEINVKKIVAVKVASYAVAKIKNEILSSCLTPGGGGGGGEALPQGPRHYHYPSIHHFSQKRYPFRIPSIDKWYPFHMPCLELCIRFNCCNCTVF